MANFQNQQLTNAGWDALSEALAGQRLKFVRMAVGDGELAAGAAIEEQTGLVHHVMDATITDYRAAGQGKIFITGIIRSAEVDTGFFLREIGLYATLTPLPEGSATGAPLLYSLSNAEEEPDYIPARGEATIVIQAIEVQVLISKAEHVEVEVVIGEVGIDGENVGGGAGLFIERVANRMRFKSLVPSPGFLPIEITQTPTTIGLAVGAGAGANGGGAPGEEGDTGTGEVPHDAIGSGVGVIQVGTLLPFAGAIAPRGYLVANGREVRRAGYPALFAVIGTTYGAGNGATTFNLPDCRSRALVGIGPLDGSSTHNFTLGLKYGVHEVALSAAQLASHSHTVDIDHYHNITVNDHNHADPGHGHGVGDPSHTHAGYLWIVGRAQMDTGAQPCVVSTNQGNAGYMAPFHAGTGIWIGGAGAGLYNAGALGGSTWWASQMGQHGKTSYAAGGNAAHENCPPSLGINYIIKI